VRGSPASNPLSEPADLIAFSLGDLPETPCQASPHLEEGFHHCRAVLADWTIRKNTSVFASCATARRISCRKTPTRRVFDQRHVPETALDRWPVGDKLQVC